MKKTLMIAMLSTSLLASGVAMADPYYDGGQQGNNQQQPQHSYNNQQGQGYHEPRPSSDWQRGQPMPQRYNDRHYAVSDWQDRGLPEPPHGQRWMYVNGEYVLTAIATGVISAILLGAIYGPMGGGHGGR